jgi:hypothetical protein
MAWQGNGTGAAWARHAICESVFILHGELAPGICALLLQPNSYTHFDFRVNFDWGFYFD